MKQSMLDELYYGNIQPDAQRIVRGSDYDRALKRVCEIERGGCDDDETQKQRIESVVEAYTTMLSVSSREKFKQGFCLGMRMGMEIMEEDGEQLKSLYEDDER